MHQAVHVAAVALYVDQERRRHLVPVPRVVPVILVVAAQLAGLDVEREHGARVEVVARSPVAGPRPGIPGAPVRETERRIEAARDPNRRAARLPRVARPGFVTGLAGPR